ncbi:MAG: pantoate--beta-alanine ligase [Candidatus Fischerbacteria bacterium RBG_13_37_8]|uniref:Pantothenate synthetase n=1 Tax=Candidatus Fischerbacteria bacterium RBG_13_37_8 TaxID=1817863 RepID=A0A1F5VMC0_9BACT|nr:MAG: pantoate--beta-alanine ligase [Candidatus Fischerbacteria bacterium RBG_13_37_8]
MENINRIARMKELVKDIKKECKTIGFVPTMGALHEGHLSLVREARRMSDVVVVSVFVNPKQFGPGEDFEHYPRNIAQDTELLQKENVDYVFHPAVEEMFPNTYKTYIIVEDLSAKLCGKSRPGHFRGVTTVVMKLFNIVHPNFVFFGQKDAQQALIIKRMLKDLASDIEFIILPIVRDPNGLAFSSRNEYLTPEERNAAPILYAALMKAHERIKKGEKKAAKILSLINEMISSEPLAKIDYIEIVDLENLEPVKSIEKTTLIALAVFFGTTRLIDNIIVEAR